MKRTARKKRQRYKNERRDFKKREVGFGQKRSPGKEKLSFPNNDQKNGPTEKEKSIKPPIPAGELRRKLIELNSEAWKRKETSNSSAPSRDRSNTQLTAGNCIPGFLAAEEKHGRGFGVRVKLSGKRPECSGHIKRGTAFSWRGQVSPSSAKEIVLP